MVVFAGGDGVYRFGGECWRRREMTAPYVLCRLIVAPTLWAAVVQGPRNNNQQKLNNRSLPESRWQRDGRCPEY